MLFRFQNKALGDTVFRVGRDLKRKLGRDDRILGSVGLCLKHDLSNKAIIDVFYSALNFKATNQNGESFAGDVQFLDDVNELGIEKTLTKLCGLDFAKDRGLIDAMLSRAFCIKY